MRTSLPMTLLLLLAPAGALAQPAAAPPPARAPASQPAGDPFERMPFIFARDKLPPLQSVRVRTSREAADRSREGKISVLVSSSPTGAAVYYGRNLLGTTPFSIGATKGSTPYDVVIRRKGYMTLRTRVQRRESRSYYFKLNPAKFR